LAEIVLGIGSSHGPTMKTAPERWPELGEKDQLDTRFDFPALRANAKPGLADEITPGKMRERFDTVQRDIETLTNVIREAAPDVVVVISNPHGGVVHDRMQPMFGVYLNDAPPLTEAPRWSGFEHGPQTAAREAPAEPARGRESRQFPAHGDLARHLMNGLVEEGIDMAASFQSKPGANLDMAFNLLYEIYFPDAHIPYVPLLLSRYLPNQAPPRRTYQFGQALRRVIERWDSNLKVGIMASGGLSHQIVDEDLDRMVIDALQEGDVEAMCSLDRDRLNRAPGTPEILNWVACAAAMEPTTMTLIDYQPCYRSLAGTGHGVTFGYWK
jgi:3-O-methylgallate 3,4-dioxygenase